jgi:hypothetical protein
VFHRNPNSNNNSNNGILNVPCVLHNHHARLWNPDVKIRSTMVHQRVFSISALRVSVRIAAVNNNHNNNDDSEAWALVVTEKTGETSVGKRTSTTKQLTLLPTTVNVNRL